MNEDFAEKILRDTWPLVTDDCYLKFIGLWVVFEVWVKDKSGFEKTRDALYWFKNTPNSLKDEHKAFWDSSKVKVFRNVLANTGSRYGVEIRNSKDPNEIIEGIYQVRNNLVHGDWQIIDPPDPRSNEYKNLIYASAEILRRWIEIAHSDKILYD